MPSRPQGGDTFVAVPIDERLEKRAQEYIRSKALWQREEGARALRYFKSKENTARVKALLNDPAWEVVRRATENRGIEVRLYSVRQAAYETLKYWGLKANKPIIRAEIQIAR